MFVAYYLDFFRPVEVGAGASAGRAKISARRGRAIWIKRIRAGFEPCRWTRFAPPLPLHKSRVHNNYTSAPAPTERLKSGAL